MPDGPIIPKYYATKTSDAPTPTAAKLEEGEIITCTKTGRMWTKCLGTVVPITVEYSFTNGLGETTAGIKRSLAGTAPFQSAQVNVYGSGGLKVDAGVSATTYTGTTYTGTGLDINGVGQINIKTTLSAANPLHLMSSKPTMSNSGIATGSDCHWFSVTSTLGSEFGDLGGGGGAYRTNAVIDGSGLKVPAIPSKYMLSTDSSGRLQAATADFGTAARTSNFTASATPNTEETVVSTSLAAGTWLLIAQATCTHGNAFFPTIGIKNVTATTVLGVASGHGAGTNPTPQLNVITIATLATTSTIDMVHVSNVGSSVVLANPTNSTISGGTNQTTFLKWVRLA